MTRSDGRFGDFVRNLRQVADSPVTLGLAGVIVAIQLVVSRSGGPEGLEGVFYAFGLSSEGFWSGKVWQLASYGLLHGGGWHVAMNAVLVLLVGSRIEWILGGKGVWWVSVWGVLAGGAFHLLLGSGLLVGFSAACFAMVLVLTTVSPQSRMMPLPVSGRSLGMGVLVAAGALALVDPAAELPGLESVGSLAKGLGWSGLFSMGHACHFGGALAGFCFAKWVLRPRVSLERLQADRARREGREGREGAERNR